MHDLMGNDAAERASQKLAHNAAPRFPSIVEMFQPLIGAATKPRGSGTESVARSRSCKKPVIDMHVPLA
jgi:hypothetical protein